MNDRIPNIHEEATQISYRLLTIELVAMAEKLAAQRGENCPRPVAKDQLKEVLDVLNLESRMVSELLLDHWRAKGFRLKA